MLGVAGNVISARCWAADDYRQGRGCRTMRAAADRSRRVVARHARCRRKREARHVGTRRLDLDDLGAKVQLEARAGIVNPHGRRSAVGQTSPFRGKRGKARNRRSAAYSPLSANPSQPVGGTTPAAALEPLGIVGVRSRATGCKGPRRQRSPNRPAGPGSARPPHREAEDRCPYQRQVVKRHHRRGWRQ